MNGGTISRAAPLVSVRRAGRVCHVGPEWHAILAYHRSYRLGRAGFAKVRH